MNATQDSAWQTQDDSMDQMVAQDMDFSNLLNLSEIDVANFALPDHDPSQHHAQHFAVQHPNTPFNGDVSGLPDGTASHDFAGAEWNMNLDMSGNQVIHTGQAAYGQMNGSLWDAGHDTSDMGNIVYRQPQHIPPTPNSYELQGASRFPDSHLAQQQQNLLRSQAQHQLRMQGVKRDDFTPLVSPAVTPQESTFQHVQHYAVPSAYFSPLTSPALEGQTPRRQANGRTRPSTAGTSTAASPIANEIDMEMFAADGTVMADRARKPSRKGHAPRSAAASKSRVRQSPIVKAQKRKSGVMSSSISQQDLQNLMEAGQIPMVPTKAKQYQTDSSGAGSISPEPLDPVMGPPPLPGSGSTHQSPTIYAQMQQNVAKKRGPSDNSAPATPASLMSIDNARRAQATDSNVAGLAQTVPILPHDNAGFDDFALPPSASSASVPATPNLDSNFSTPRLSASRKTPKLGPLGTANAGRTSSTASPSISAIASPASALGTPGQSSDTKSRTSKKRSSVSGNPTLISPALRPKISPSIKPLLPEGANLTESQHAFLLASKSNYTNLLEGTLLPGVSYPDSLSSGLTSKRTSHKIAEQGRRNRINEALKEMQALLPPPAARVKTAKSNGTDKDVSSADSDNEAPKSSDGSDARNGDSKAAANKSSKASESSKAAAAAEAKAAHSKAATVESAIQYIKRLQQERNLMTQAMEARESEVNELRKRLRDAEFKLGRPSSDSDTASPDLSGVR